MAGTADKIREVRRNLEETEQRARKLKVELAVLTEDGFGMSGIRDPSAPCEAFEPGTPRGECETDGHYLCDECKERNTCDTGCGRRKTQCECRYCERCESSGTACECKALGEGGEWTALRFPIRSGFKPSQALRAYASAIGRGLHIEGRMRLALKAMSEIEEERERASLKEV